MQIDQQPHIVTPDLPTALVVNPHSRQGQESYAIYEKHLAEKLNLVMSHMPQTKTSLIDVIQDGLSKKIERFVVGGGDGTLSLTADLLKHTPAVLGVLPLGTGNTFALGLNLPKKPQDIVELLATGPVAQYDLGEAVTPQSERKVFLNSLTIGVSERLVELLTPTAKKEWGWMAWAIEFQKALASTPAVTVKIVWPGGQDEFTTRQFVVVNGRTLAGGLSATPHSSGQNGLLEVFRIGNPSTRSMLRMSFRLLTGRLLTDHEARYRVVKEIEIRTSPPVRVDVDGEIWQTTPVHCKVLPGALSVITPKSPEPRHFWRWPIAAQTVGQGFDAQG